MPSSRAHRPTFYEVVLVGHIEQARALLLGLLIGSGCKGRLYFSHEEGVFRRTLGEKLRELVGLSGMCHAIVDSEMRNLLKRHEKRLGAEAGVRLAEVKRICSGRFAFSYHAYARRYGRQIRDLLRSLPRGLKLEESERQETVDETAAGLEAYAPAHEYEAEGKGSVRGRIDLLIEARRRLAEHPLVRVEQIDLELA